MREEREEKGEKIGGKREERSKTRENSNFLKNGKIVISVKI